MNQPACAVTKQSGFTLIPTVLLIMGIIVVIGASISLVGTNAVRNVSLITKSFKANGLVNACIEEALVKIQQNNLFSGLGSLTLSTGGCSYNVENTGGENRNITASSTVSFVTRKVKVSIDHLSPAVHINKWQEVAD